MRKRLQIALLVETSSRYGRGVLTGIAKYLNNCPHWSILLEEIDVHHVAPRWLEKQSVHGIISRVTDEYLRDYAAKMQIPIVELTDRYADTELHALRSDDQTIGEMAAEHLMERGFRNFAFCGFLGEAWSQRRYKGVQERLTEAGFVSHCLDSDWLLNDASNLQFSQDRVSDWVRALPKPVGVMACNDMRGQHVLSACRWQGIDVPEVVAAIGVDNDELHCGLSQPPLTSVIPDTESIGYKAAEVLSRLMEGQSVEPRLMTLPPLGIKARQSTDTIAVPDPEISAAIAFIRGNACRGIGVTDILQAVPISRSGLERGMRKYVNRSPKQEIRKVQIQHATRLLLETDFSIDHIAHLCGFKHPEYMHVVFKRDTGRRPGAVRSHQKF